MCKHFPFGKAVAGFFPRKLLLSAAADYFFLSSLPAHQATTILIRQYSKSVVEVNALERELLAIAKSGDSAALGRLYDAYAPRLLGFILRMTGNQQKAEEILQSTFLEVFGRIRNYDPSSEKLFPWMLKIARAQAQQAIQVENNTANAEIRKDANLVNGSDVEAAAHSTLMDLLYVQGRTFAQISQELGLSVEALKTKIRTELKQYRQGPPHA
jgi:RNA polymerase sigma-70 factor (ECF subfamily)